MAKIPFEASSFGCTAPTEHFLWVHWMQSHCFPEVGAYMLHPSSLIYQWTTKRRRRWWYKQL